MKRGLLLKTWFYDWPLEKVLELGIKDFKQNYEDYIGRFARH